MTRELAEGVDAHREELDDKIAADAKGWTVDRIAPLDMNVMRVALYEIESRTHPAEVAIDEAVEIAKGYCGAQAPGFVNGILGAIVRERGSRRMSARLREISRPPARDRPELEGGETPTTRRPAGAREAADLAAEAVEEANREARQQASAE